MSDAEKLDRAMFAIACLTVLERLDGGAVVIGPVGWDILERTREELAAAEFAKSDG